MNRCPHYTFRPETSTTKGHVATSDGDQEASRLSGAHTTACADTAQVAVVSGESLSSICNNQCYAHRDFIQHQENTSKVPVCRFVLSYVCCQVPTLTSVLLLKAQLVE